MGKYPNQTTIKITNIKPIYYMDGKPVGNGFYPTLYYDYVDKAASLLNGNAFKLWLYLIRWHSKGYVYLSPAAIKDRMGMSKSSVSDAKKELINKGFLKEEENGELIFTPISTTLV